MKQEYSASAISCHWCGTPLGNASRIIYLNGNLPVCDMCLIKQGYFVTFAPIDGTEKEDGDVGKERGGSWIRTLCDKCNGEKR